MQNRKYFITGASGFIGSHILNQLIDDGFSCSALYRNPPPFTSNHELINGDLLDPEGYEKHLENVDTIIHVAGAISYKRKDRSKLTAANYLATKDLVNSALHYQVPNFIYISSAATLIRSEDPLHISVGTAGVPIFNSWYAKTKFLGELEIRRAAAEGMNICILHPSLVIGHWNWKSTSMQIFNKVASGISHYPPGNLGIVSVQDLALIVGLICKEGINGQQFLLNAETWAYKDFLNEIATSLQLKAIHREAAYWQANSLALLDSLQFLWNGKKALITKEIIKSSFSKFNYDSALSLHFADFKYQDIRKLIPEIVKYHSE